MFPEAVEPDFLSPFMSCSSYFVDNMAHLQQLMYRPLYWVGKGTSTSVQYSLSPADPPIVSPNDKTFTVKLRGWRFSNGTKVDARSVMLFLNIYRSDPSNYCEYVSGFGIDELTTVTAPAGLSGNEVRLTFSRSENPKWVLYDFLADITPMPHKWDTTGGGVNAGCAAGAWNLPATNVKCKAVETYLAYWADPAGNLPISRAWNTAGPAYQIPTIWMDVDGPWKLSVFDVSGEVKLVPNAAYSGPQHAQVAGLDELPPYPTDSAVQAALTAGTLSFAGFSPTASSTGPPCQGAPAIAGYAYQCPYFFGFNFISLGFNASGGSNGGEPDAGVPAAEIHQLYIRRALQESLDPTAILAAESKGYGFPNTCGPTPPGTAGSACAYPHSAVAAAALLTSHGWQVRNSVQTCVRPGTGAADCGAEIAYGDTLTLTSVWAGGSSDNATIDAIATTVDSEWGAIGIAVSRPAADSAVSYEQAVEMCKDGTAQICPESQGWEYVPDYYPTGESLFLPEAAYNLGDYVSSTLTGLIDQSIHGAGNLSNYADFVSKQLPVLFLPQPSQPYYSSTNLRGLLSVNPQAAFLPEFISCHLGVCT